MKPATDEINRELLVLTEAFADASIGPAEFRRRRRELVCSWTGEAVPLMDQALPDEDDTQPALKPITDQDIAAAKPAAAPGRRGWWFTILLLLVAGAGAAALLWFVLRRSV